MKLIKFIFGFLILLVLIMVAHAGENDPVCFGNTTTDTVCVGGDEGIVNATGEGHFVTVNTGQGNNELYAMNQDIESTDAVTFATINTGHGAQEVYGINTTVFVVQGDNIGVVKTWLDGLYCLLTGCTMSGDIAMDGNDITGAADVNGTGELNFATLNTGQGDNELYDMDQNVLKASNVVFNSVNASLNASYIQNAYWCALTGCTMSGNIAMGTNSITGATDINSTNIHITNLYVTNLESNLDGTGFNITAATLNTGQGAHELYAMDQDVQQADGVTFATVDTGQGANELYDMDQNVLTSSDVTFDNLTVSTKITDGTLTITSGAITGATDVNGSGELNFATINTGHGDQEVYGINTTVFVVQGDNIGIVKTWLDGLYCLLTGCTMSGDIAMGGSSITGALDINATGRGNFVTINTGQGDYELYAMNQDVESTDAVTFGTVDTGQGANELYDMDQNVLQASDVTFDNVTVSTKFTDGTLTISGGSITAGVDANFTGLGNFATVNTGHGAQEVYGLNTSAFAVQGDNIGVVLGLWDGLYCQLVGCTMAGAIVRDGNSITGALDVNGTGKLNFATLNTGQGDYELYAMDQDVEQADNVVFASVDTGQGANELYDMDQNVLTTSAVTFNNVTSTIRVYVGGILGVLTGSSAANNYLSVGNNMIYDGIALNILNASQNGSGIYFDNEGYIGFYSHDGSSTKTLLSIYDDDIVGVNSMNTTSVHITQNITNVKCIYIDNGAKIGNCG